MKPVAGSGVYITGLPLVHEPSQDYRGPETIPAISVAPALVPGKQLCVGSPLTNPLSIAQSYPDNKRHTEKVGVLGTNADTVGQ